MVHTYLEVYGALMPSLTSEVELDQVIFGLQHALCLVGRAVLYQLSQLCIQGLGDTLPFSFPRMLNFGV